MLISVRFHYLFIYLYIYTIFKAGPDPYLDLKPRWIRYHGRLLELSTDVRKVPKSFEYTFKNTFFPEKKVNKKIYVCLPYLKFSDQLPEHAYLLFGLKYGTLLIHYYYHYYYFLLNIIIWNYTRWNV